MTRLCENCQHWTRSEYSKNLLPCDAMGVCDALPGCKMLIALRTGWEGGYVCEIETQCDFSCDYYKELDDREKIKGKGEQG